MKHPLYVCTRCSKIFKSYNKYEHARYCTRKCFLSREVSEETRIKQSIAKKGKSPWNKGIKMWENRIHPKGTLGMKGLNKGKIITDETRKKQKIAHLGIKLPNRSKENHHNWKGGITSENIAIRSSSDYKNWRNSVFERDKYICQICFSVGGKLHADHIIPFSMNREKRFDVSNGRTLCVECHYKTDTYGGKMYRKSKRITC